MNAHNSPDQFLHGVCSGSVLSPAVGAGVVWQLGKADSADQMAAAAGEDLHRRLTSGLTALLSCSPGDVVLSWLQIVLLNNPGPLQKAEKL